MKNVKQMIKKLSDEQDIHDVSNDVLKNVDMNKVRNQAIVKTPEPKRIILFSNLISAFAAAMLVVLVVVLVNSNTKPEDNKPTGDDIVEPTKENTETNFEDNYLMFTQYLKDMQKQEAYNMINVVPSISNITFNSVTFNTNTKRMSESEMEALVDTVDSQIYNIEEMLGLTSIKCESSTNQYYGIDESDYKDYENVISVTGPLSSYHLYFSEEDVISKNVGKTNFKSNSNIYGLIDSENALVSFKGQKEYKNGKTTYLTKFKVNDLIIYVEEVFGEKTNEFTYTFYKDNLVKNIFVKQNFYDDGNIRIEFKAVYARNVENEDDWSKSTTIVAQTKNIENSNVIEFKVDSRDNDTLTVTRNETYYTYKFGNNDEIVYNR